MIDIKLSPPREGTRGGREQFKWDDLRTHDPKDLEHYLGGTIKLGVIKRKNQFYKHDWYLNKREESQNQEPDELKLTKLYEDEIMKEMLGTKPKRLMLLKTRPTDINELRKLLLEPSEDQDSEQKLHKRNRNRSRERSPECKSHRKRHSRSRSRDSSLNKSHRRRSRSRHRNTKHKYRSR